MFATLRKYVKSAVIVVLFGLLILSFAIFQTNDSFAPQLSSNVVVAGSRKVTAQDFANDFNNRKQELEQRNDQPISLEEAARNGLPNQLLQLMASEEALSEAISKLGVRASPNLIVAQLREIPAFFNQITGKFDPEAYRGRLQENNTTDKKFEALIGDGIAREHFFTGLQAGLINPRTYGAFQAVYALENRAASVIVVDPGKVPAPAPPTEAQLATFLTEVADRVRKPEIRRLTIVRFSTKEMAPTMPVNEEEVTKLYEFRKDQVSKPELRTVIQVPAKDQATAAAIAARLNKGEDANAIAKALGVTAITHTDKPKTAIIDRKVADAAFSLPAGQISRPVQGELGFAVVKVVSITPGQQIGLDQVRPQIEAEVKQRAAEQHIAELADKFEEAHASGASVADAAKTVGLAAITTPLLAANGNMADGKVAPGVSPKLLDTAFKLPLGGESDIENEGQGEYYVVRVEEVQPPALPTVDEIRPQLVRAFIAREYERRLQAKAEELAGRLRKGEAIETVASAVGARVSRLAGIDRMNAERQAQVVGAPFMQAALGAKAGDVFVAPAPGGGIIVAKVESVSAGEPQRLAQMTVAARQSISRDLFQTLQQQVGLSAVAAVKAKTYPEKARAALGLPPEEAPAAAKGKKG